MDTPTQADFDNMAEEESSNPLWYDYERQAWIKNGKYMRCSHHRLNACSCYGRLREGETAEPQSLL